MKKRCLFVVLLAGCTVTAAFAQEPAKPSNQELSVELNPVVVTGTGTHNRLKNTPAPVDVVTAADIKKAGITDFQQAMTMLVPSLSFSTTAMGSYLMMNGLSNKYVLVLINGKKLIGDALNNIDLSRIDMNNVKRIEVLKGAGSALYGSDAIGGVINIITDTPINLLTVTSNTRVEEYGQFTQGATVDVSTSKFGSHTSYTRRQADGWQLSGVEENGEATTKNASNAFYSNILNQQFTFTPNDKISGYVEGGFFDRKVKRPTPVYNYDLGYDSYNLGAGAKYRFNEKAYIQLDLKNDNYDTKYHYTVDGKNNKVGDSERVKRQRYYQANLKSFIRTGENARTVLGLEYVNESLERASFGVDKAVSTYAAYAQEEMTLLKDLQVVAGLRYTYHENAGSNVTPKIALMYRLGHFNLRAQYAAGFRAPALDELYKLSLSTRGTAALGIGNTNLHAEKSHYGSVNVEYTNAWLSVGVTGYINSIRDMINARTVKLADMSPAEQEEIKKLALMAEGATPEGVAKLKNVTRFVNDEDALVKGFEVNLNSNLGAGFSLGGSYVYTYARNKDIETGWRPIQLSVRHSGSVNANYVRSWGDYRLNVNLNSRIQSKRTHLTLTKGEWEDESAPGFAQWNLNTRHSFDGFEHFTIEPGIGVDNLLNKVDRRPYGVNYSSLNPGRTVYVSLLLRFKK
ncbi:TonB-dependent receptor [Bacteroides sp.]|uniref:TonB-dependent receptor plug domain-containing protein n=1 Tax=Bacteroides sp. TaxID=29523 RepID=UPI002FC9F930